MKAIALFFAILLALLAVPMLFVDQSGQPAAPDAQGLPWQIELLPDGRTRVFGLVPGVSTFEEASRHLVNDPQLGLIVTPGRHAMIEAYFDSVSLGGVTGRVILSFEVDSAWRDDILGRARKIEVLESLSRKVELAVVDRQRLAGNPVSAIAFIPAANLDEQIIIERFGPPAERIRSGEHTEHFLYPAKGLELRLDAKGKEVLQYVTPRDFPRLRDPLMVR